MHFLFVCLLNIFWWEEIELVKFFFRFTSKLALNWARRGCRRSIAEMSTRGKRPIQRKEKRFHATTGETLEKTETIGFWNGGGDTPHDAHT